VNSNRTEKQKAKRKPRKESPRGVLPAIFAAVYHKVLYRPSQVMLSMPCFREGQKPTVGMRLAILDQTGECRLEEIPEPIFCTGVIERVTGDTVTLKYDKHPSGAVSLTFGWESMKVFCVPLPDDREKWTQEFTRRHREEWGR